uniref:Uncharacterized protein n=1 Tax=Pyxicephalus adspersus TaxID=30357 RepID=A0AAV2ZEZ7_PYXAD|nr:TPA: hypothetical protein GDO54_004104 [Pyxicephalus adspersus]
MQGRIKCQIKVWTLDTAAYMDSTPRLSSVLRMTKDKYKCCKGKAREENWQVIQPTGYYSKLINTGCTESFEYRVILFIRQAADLYFCSHHTLCYII